MDVSLAQTIDLTCPACGKSFTADIWLIVDGGARPDLVARAREGMLHTFSCPTCRHEETVNAPVLFYLPDRNHPLLFSPAQETVAVLAFRQGLGLVSILSKKLGATWSHDGMQAVPRHMLHLALGEDSEGMLAAARVEAKRRQETAVAARDALDGLLPEARATALVEAILSGIPIALRPEDLNENWFATLTALQADVSPDSDRGQMFRSFRDQFEAACAQMQLISRVESVLQELDRPSRPQELEHRIEQCRQAIALVSCNLDPQLWAALEAELGSSFGQYTLGSRADNFEQAILHLGRALQVYSREGSPEEWAAAHNNLGKAYHGRICGDRADNIEEALQHYSLALQVYSREIFPVDWAMTQTNLADVIFEHIRGNRSENIEQALHLYTLSLQVYSREAFPVEWAMIQNKLGNVYRNRVQGKHAENLEQAIHHCELALQIYTYKAFPAEWATAQNNLANGYLNRVRGDRADNIEKAIHHYLSALQVYTPEIYPVEWAMMQINLAYAYQRRNRGERAHNLEKAIYHLQIALQTYTRKAFPEQWGGAQLHLGNAYRNRIRGDHAENVEQAIRHYRRALRVHTRDVFPEQWALAHNNLGNAFVDRIRGDRGGNIEQAMHHYRLALRVYTQEDFPTEWAMAQSNLANALANRIYNNHATNSEQAVKHYTLALEIYTTEDYPADWAKTHYNLANTYWLCTQGDRADNCEQAIQHYELALQVYTREAFPVHHRDAHGYLGRIRFDRREWQEALSSLRDALDTADLLYGLANSPDARANEARKVQGLASLVAYALLQTEDSPQAVQEAVTILERNRARWLGELLDLDRRRPTGVPDALWETFEAQRKRVRELIGDLRALEGLRAEDELAALSTQTDGTPASRRGYQELNPLLQGAREELDRLIDAIHTYDEGFMPVPSFASVQVAASITPLVYLIATPAGGLALIVAGTTVFPLWLNALTDEALDQHLSTWFGAYTASQAAYMTYRQALNTLEQPTDAPEEQMESRLRARQQLDAAQAAWQAAMQGTLDWLRDTAMAPLAAALKERGLDRAILIPSGGLGLLPLHAAAPDDVVLSYAPSARALTASRQVGAAFDGPAARPLDLFAVDNPDGSLTYTGKAMEAIAAHFDHPFVAQGPMATMTTALHALRTFGVCHFFCHGLANPQAPLDSGLQLYYDKDDDPQDALLRVRDIMAAHGPGMRLAFLAACESNLPDPANLDEVIALPTALQQAGVAGVVGTLWSVNEASTALLAARFYRLWREEGLEPAVALHRAARWLRDGGYGFESPYYWAGFTFTGV